MDEALNVVFPINCEGRDDITVYMAHTEAERYNPDKSHPSAPGSEIAARTLVETILESE